MYFQDAFHLCKRLMRFCNACSDCLGTVHTGTAAKTDDRFASGLVPEVFGFFYIDSSWIGNRFVINGIRNIIFFQSFFQAFCQSQTADAFICDDQNVSAFLFEKNFRQGLHASDNFRVAVWKERKSEFECFLESTTVNFSQCIHKSKILSMI